MLFGKYWSSCVSFRCSNPSFNSPGKPIRSRAVVSLSERPVSLQVVSIFFGGVRAITYIPVSIYTYTYIYIYHHVFFFFSFLLVSFPFLGGGIESEKERERESGREKGGEGGGRGEGRIRNKVCIISEIFLGLIMLGGGERVGGEVATIYICVCVRARMSTYLLVKRTGSCCSPCSFKRTSLLSFFLLPFLL
ncbi:hypothetical protein F5X99DRAFT_268913 [Biscogniauxia marginata]|nr:hypothetical protein F5X99DRAFT_268913 [Biscogniauxia marginata]